MPQEPRNSATPVFDAITYVIAHSKLLDESAIKKLHRILCELIEQEPGAAKPPKSGPRRAAKATKRKGRRRVDYLET